MDWNVPDAHQEYQNVRESLIFRFSRAFLEGFMGTSDTEAPVTLNTNLKSMTFLVTNLINMYQEWNDLDELRRELEEENQ